MFVYVCAKGFEEGFSESVSAARRGPRDGDAYIRSKCEESGTRDWTEDAF